MTDNEIIKALECDLTLSVKVCPECPYFRKRNGNTHCASILLQDAIDLINRQKAEIERLQSPCEMQIEISKKIENSIKAEAIREVVKKVKSSLWDLPTMCDEEGEYDYVCMEALEDFLDNLVKEKAGAADENI